jgi:hypothetical protein
MNYMQEKADKVLERKVYITLRADGQTSAQAMSKIGEIRDIGKGSETARQ